MEGGGGGSGGGGEQAAGPQGPPGPSPAHLGDVLPQQLHEQHAGGQGEQHPIPDLPVQHQLRCWRHGVHDR